MKNLNSNGKEGVSFLLAEQNNVNMALKYASYGYILEKRPRRDGR